MILVEAACLYLWGAVSGIDWDRWMGFYGGIPVLSHYPGTDILIGHREGQGNMQETIILEPVKNKLNLLSSTSAISMKLPEAISQNAAFIILHLALGGIFITHGLARLYYGSVPDFGGFLNAQGFIIGLPLAWTITIGEIISGSLLVLRRYVRLCVLFHAVIIIGGLLFIHIPEGWFVVGHGSGGSEYSLLILAVLTVMYSREGEITKVDPDGYN